MSRKARFQSILLDKNFEPENPKSLEELTEDTCKWPIGHPNEENFIFAEENLSKIFLIANYILFTHFSLKDKKMKFLKKTMRYQNLLRKRSNPLVNSRDNGIYKQIP